MIPGITASRNKVSGPPPTDGDPYWSSVVFLMHFDGSITDVKGGTFTEWTSPVDFTPGRFDLAMSTLVSGYGVTEPSQRSVLDLPGDFTIEGFVKLAAGASGVFINRFGPTGNGWQIYIESTGKLSFWQYQGGYIINNAGPDIRDGAWHHIAVSRTGLDVRMFLDGVQIGSSQSSSIFTSDSARLSVGFQIQGSQRYPLKSEIDEVRITKGVGRYTSNFAPISQPFPNH